MLARTKLSDAFARKLEPPKPDTPEHKKGYVIVADTDSPLKLRVTNGGARAWIVEYRVRRRERSYTIGKITELGCAQAREEARRIARQAHDGADPLADRDAPTVDKLCDRYVTEILPGKRETTRKDYAGIIDREIRPALGKLRVIDVTVDDVAKLHSKISERAPYRANRVLAVIGAMFTIARYQWRWAKESPAKGITRNPEHGRERYLQSGEVARLLEALDRHPDQIVADMLRVLLFTGARRSEVISMRWADVIDGVWLKPATTTKQKKPHRIPLSVQVQAILARQPQSGDLVFPGTPLQHRSRLQRAWRSVTKAAEIRGMRLHDARHSYASTLANMGVSLQTVGALLGHSKITTTQRYAHLYDETLRAATDRAADALAAARNPAAEVVPLRKGGVS